MRVIAALKAIIALGVVLIAVPAHPQSAGLCRPESPELLSCVAGQLRGIKDVDAARPMISRLREALDALGSKDNYGGEVTDVNELKRVSKLLKIADKDKNYDEIAFLDEAIGSYTNEIRTALSPRTAMAGAQPGADIHDRFVQQKLEYLKSDKAAQDYDDGPFDLARRGLLAGAMEDSYFLERSKGQDGKNLLNNELNIINDIVARLERDQYKTLLSKQNRDKQQEINSNMFWRSTVLFLLGDLSGARGTLNEIIQNNIKFGLETKNYTKQLYLYRLFNEQYKIIVQPDGASPLKTTDPNLLKRFYNAAQLSVVVCGAASDAPTDDAIKSLKKVVSDFEPHDYSVIAARAANPADITKLETAINQSLQQEKWNEARAGLVKRVADESKQTLQDMKVGASSCGVKPEDLKKVYAPFEFKSQVVQIGSSSYLVFGGALTESQATRVAEFLSGLIGGLEQGGAKEFRPYAARALVN